MLTFRQRCSNTTSTVVPVASRASSKACPLSMRLSVVDDERVVSSRSYTTYSRRGVAVCVSSDDELAVIVGVQP